MFPLQALKPTLVTLEISTTICLAWYELVWHCLLTWAPTQTRIHIQASYGSPILQSSTIFFKSLAFYGILDSSTQNKLWRLMQSPLRGSASILILDTQPFHQYELCVYVFYIITDLESIDILIKGSKYWVGAPTAHPLSLPQGVDRHNPLRGVASSITSLWHGEECWGIWSPASFKE